MLADFYHFAHLERPVRKNGNGAEEVGDCILCRQSDGNTADTGPEQKRLDLARRPPLFLAPLVPPVPHPQMAHLKPRPLRQHGQRVRREADHVIGTAQWLNVRRTCW